MKPYAWLTALIMSCQPAPAPAATPAPCVADLNALTCVLPTVARNESNGVAWGNNTQMTSASCGVTVSTVTAMWAAHTQAESLEGFVPKPQN